MPDNRPADPIRPGDGGNPNHPDACGTCGGSGKLIVSHPSDPRKDKATDCGWCGGRGVR